MIKIVSCDVLQHHNVMIVLSDGRVLVLTLDQLLSLKPEPMPFQDEPEASEPPMRSGS